MRFFLDISFQGTEYAGWQIQPNAIAVQQKINEALSIIFRQDLHCVGAGRTDAGVHARQMFAHFDVEMADNQLVSADSISLWRASLNGVLPYDIAINKLLVPQSESLHSRFNALSRTYEYHIVFKKSPFDRDYTLWVKRRIDFEAMQIAADSLLAYKDFASFCKSHGDNKTTLCELDRAEWEMQGEKLIFHVRANRFLRGMVRALVGTLLEVGEGKLSLDDFRKIVEARDRKQAGPNVEAKGLFLTEVCYPDGSFL